MIRRATLADCDQVAELRGLLWHGCPPDEARELLASGVRGGFPAVVFVAEENEVLIAMLQAGLRSHAEGCDVRQPVGYIEGWYVRKEFRGRGLGSQLMHAAEAWARDEQGCKELASDTWADSGNEDAVRVHQSLGFEVVERLVAFRKPL